MDLTQLNDYTTRSEAVCRRNDTISPRLYEEYGVKKGLRDENGNGVLAGLTNISKITSSKIVDGKKISMTPKEYELLFYLVNNAGIAISREKLLNDVWGYDFYGDDRTVDTHIKMLRASLGEYRNKIVTLRGLGYKIEL